MRGVRFVIALALAMLADWVAPSPEDVAPERPYDPPSELPAALIAIELESVAPKVMVSASTIEERAKLLDWIEHEAPASWKLLLDATTLRRLDGQPDGLDGWTD